jgi:hypothetical protein
MATYISDSETCKLIAKYAELEGKSKTAALRDLLRTAIEDARYRAGAKERYEKVMASLQKRKAKHAPIPKKVFDDLFEIEEQRAQLTKNNSSRPRRKSV